MMTVSQRGWEACGQLKLQVPQNRKQRFKIILLTGIEPRTWFVWTLSSTTELHPSFPTFSLPFELPLHCRTFSLLYPVLDFLVWQRHKIYQTREGWPFSSLLVVPRGPGERPKKQPPCRLFPAPPTLQHEVGGSGLSCQLYLSREEQNGMIELTRNLFSHLLSLIL